MRQTISASLGVLVLILSNRAFGQDTCTSLLEHGIYNHFRESNVSDSTSEMNTEVCNTYQRYMTDKKNGNAQASYGLFDGSVELSAEKLEQSAQTMCQSDYSYKQASALVKNSRDIISSQAVEAWQACVKSYARGLRPVTTFTDERILSISIEYSLPPGQKNYPSVDAIVIQPKDSLICQGSLVKAVGRPMTSDVLSAVCNRTVNAKLVDDGNRKVFAPPAVISVQTSAGAITAVLPAVIPKVARSEPPSLPAGTVVAFAGNDLPPGWFLCDGHEVSRSLYPRLAKTLGDRYGKANAGMLKLPDYRGLFLRGTDGGSGRDPDKTTRTDMDGKVVGDVLGSLQSDQFRSHTHRLPDRAGAPRPDQALTAVGDPGYNQGTQYTFPEGGSETRPRNISVRYLIKY